MALNSKFLYFYKYVKVFSQSGERSWFSRLAYQFPRLGGGASLRQRRSRDRRRRRRHAQRERSLRKRTTASFGYLPSTLRIWRFVPPGVSHFRKARSAFARESIGFLSFLRLHVGFVWDSILVVALSDETLTLLNSYDAFNATSCHSEIGLHPTAVRFFRRDSSTKFRKSAT